MALILVADDDLALAALMEDHLSRQKHEVIVVNDGYELSQQAVARQPELIITDIQMPGAFGSSVYKILQEDPKTKGIPIIFISAHPQEKVQKLLPTAENTRFVHKPFKMPDLDKAIKELVPS